jgi:ribosomal protein S19
MMNLVFFVYYGNKYKKIIIQEIHIGIILGSLLLTRFNNGHLHKEKIKKSNIIKKKKK